DLLDLRPDPVEQLAGQFRTRVGVDREGRKAMAAHHHRVFPDNFGPGRHLAQGDHASADRAPDLQTVDVVDIFALAQVRPRDDRQWARLLGAAAHAGAPRFAVEADQTRFKAALQRLGHLDARDAVAARLVLEQGGTDDLFSLAPVAAHAQR